MSKETSICTIVSHTPYCINENGEIVGLGSTVEEIDHLSKLFIKVFHCAPLHSGEPPKSFIPHKSMNIHLIPLKPAGGKNFTEKFHHILLFQRNLRKIIFCLKSSDWLHFRAPTGLGILFLPWAFIFWKKGLWIKYAGSWINKSAPLSYKFQRLLLTIFPKNTKISINGNFENHRRNFFDFINPCFDNHTLEKANLISKEKDFNEKLKLLFVGRLGKEKGLDDLFNILQNMTNHDNIDSLTIIGESDNIKIYEKWATSLPIKVIFKGALSRRTVFKFYAKSHIIVLLSKTEGFPKVIMEAGAYGCVPLLSNLDNFRLHIKNNYNGIIFDTEIIRKLSIAFQNVLSDKSKLKYYSNNIVNTSKLFTFENYLSKIKKQVLSSD